MVAAPWQDLDRVVPDDESPPGRRALAVPRDGRSAPYEIMNSKDALLRPTAKLAGDTVITWNSLPVQS